MRAPEDDALALKRVGAINKEQYNKRPIKCAFVCLFIIHMHILIKISSSRSVYHQANTKTHYICVQLDLQLN